MSQDRLSGLAILPIVNKVAEGIDIDFKICREQSEGGGESL